MKKIYRVQWHQPQQNYTYSISAGSQNLRSNLLGEKFYSSKESADKKADKIKSESFYLNLHLNVEIKEFDLED